MGKGPGIDEFLRHGDEVRAGLPRRYYRALATVLGPLARTAGSLIGRRARSGPEGLEDQAAKFEASADQMTAELTAEQLAAPLAPDENAHSLWPNDPRWKRRAIEHLRQSARELREIAAQRRAPRRLAINLGRKPVVSLSGRCTPPVALGAPRQP